MYKINYKIISENNGDTRKSKTTFSAEFRFGQEVAPKNRKEVKKRINELYEKEDIPFLKVCNYAITQNIRVDTFPFKLGFNLSMEKEGIIPLEKIIDLDTLNKFILTGEY